MDSHYYQIMCGPDSSSRLATWPGRTSLKIIPVLYKPAIARSKELEAASRSSKIYLAKDGGGRSAPIQSWSRVRASESTKQNNLADTHRNSNVTDKLRLIRTMALYSSHHFNEQCSRPFSQNKHYRQQLVQLSRSLYKRQ